MKGKPARGSSEASPLGALHPDRARRASLGGRAEDRRTPLGRMAGASLRLSYRLERSLTRRTGWSPEVQRRGRGGGNGECAHLSLLLPEKTL